jgi:peroxin-2
MEDGVARRFVKRCVRGCFFDSTFTRDACARTGKSKLVAPSVVRKALFALLFVGGGYAWSKIGSYCKSSTFAETSQQQSSVANKQTIWKWMDRLERLFTVLTFVNFIAFLVQGRSVQLFRLRASMNHRSFRYPSLLQRLLRLQLVPIQQGVSRNASFDYLNRELVWQHMTVRTCLFSFSLPAPHERSFGRT